MPLGKLLKAWSVRMKIIEKTESRERCAEAGWYAWDFILDAPMDDAFILSLRPLGSLAKSMPWRM